MSNMINPFYYEYIIKIFDDVDQEEVIRSGVLPAESISDAVSELSDYYGEDNIMEIQMLKILIDGVVFEFQHIAEEGNFDFVISKKEV